MAGALEPMLLLGIVTTCIEGLEELGSSADATSSLSHKAARTLGQWCPSCRWGSVVDNCSARCLTKFAPFGVESSVKSVLGVILSLMTLQMSSTRAQELERTAIFLEFCTGTQIADRPHGLSLP